LIGKSKIYNMRKKLKRKDFQNLKKICYTFIQIKIKPRDQLKFNQVSLPLQQKNMIILYFI